MTTWTRVFERVRAFRRSRLFDDLQAVDSSPSFPAHGEGHDPKTKQQLRQALQHLKALRLAAERG